MTRSTSQAVASIHGDRPSTTAPRGRFRTRTLTSPLALALEPRFMFDAAGVATGGEAAVDAAAQEAADQQTSNPPTDDPTDPLVAALGETSPPADRTEVVFVDPSIHNYQALLTDVHAAAQVVILDPAADGLTQIADVLSGRSDIDAIHIVSHGGVGTLAFGTGTVTIGNLADHAQSLDRIGAAMTPNGDILLYGCYVGADAAGRDFITQFADLTGTDVAASDDLTGTARLGADWDLEAKAGEIETHVFVTQAGQAAFDGVLPTFNFSLSTAGIGTPTLTETVDDVTVTITVSDGSALHVHSGFVNPSQLTSTDTYTLTFSQPVAVTGFRVGEYIQLSDGQDYVFTPNIGTTLRLANDTPGSITDVIHQINPVDWTGITSIVMSYDGATDWKLGIDKIDFTKTNNEPTVSGLPSDIGVLEDTATDVDLSAVTFADADGESLVVTLTTSAGTLAASTSGGVTIGGSGTSTLTLSGTANSINTWLDTTSNIQYTGAVNANGNDAASITVNASDGWVNPQLGTINVDITAVNDAPVLDAGASPSVTTITEDAGDDDGSGADGDDDATNNTNNRGDSIADLIVDGSITDVDGSAVEAIAVVGVNNGFGRWQYSTDNGATWANFADSNGTVDLSGNARLLDGTLTGSDTHRVRFVPNADYYGSSYTITFRAWDKTTGSAGGTADASSTGGTTAFSSATNTATITVTAVNDAPTVTGIPTDLSVTEDSLSSLDLRALDFYEVEWDAVTVTLTASAGTLVATAGHNATISSVTSSVISPTTVSFTGSHANLEVYFATVGRVQYIGASDVSGDNAATVAVSLTDGMDAGVGGTINLDITPVQDAPVLDAGASPSLTAIAEDAGDDDGSGVDGDDDATDNANNPGTTVADLVVDGSITDPDGGAVEAIAVIAVDNTNGVWQYSTDNGTNWSNFSGTTGSSVDIASAARLLDGTLTGASTHLVRFVPDADYTGSATITFRAWDKTSGTAGSTANTGSTGDATAFSSVSDTASVTVTPVNDAPVLNAGASPSLNTIAEDAGDDDGSGADGDDDATSNANNPGTSIADLVVNGSITDPDGAVEAIAVVAVDNTNGVWQYSTDNGANWNSFSGTTGTTVDIAGTARLLDGTLTGSSTHLVRFVPDADYNGSATITFRAWDKSTGSAGGTADTSSTGGTTPFSSVSDAASITVSAVNDAPVLGPGTNLVDYTEGGGPVVVFSYITLTDPDTANFASATVTIVGGGVAGDVLSTGVATPFVASYDAGTSTLTLTGPGTRAELEAALRTVTFASTSDDPTAGGLANIRTLEFQVTEDGTAVTSNTRHAQVRIIGLNDEPTLTATGTDPTFVEGSAAPGADLFDAVAVSTVEANQTVASMTLMVTNVTDGPAEVLRFDGSDVALTHGNAITSATNGLSVTVSLTGTTATVAFTGASLNTDALRTLVDDLAYSNTSDTPTEADRVITIAQLTDDGGTANGGSDTATLNLQSTATVTATNDAPAITGDLALAVTEGGTITVTTADLTENDPDDSGTGLTYTVTAGPANGQLELTSGPNTAITFFTQDDLDNGRVVYRHNGGNAASDSVQVALADGGENGATPATGVISITVVADEPESDDDGDTPVPPQPEPPTADTDTAPTPPAPDVTDPAIGPELPQPTEVATSTGQTDPQTTTEIMAATGEPDPLALDGMDFARVERPSDPNTSPPPGEPDGQAAPISQADPLFFGFPLDEVVLYSAEGAELADIDSRQGVLTLVAETTDGGTAGDRAQVLMVMERLGLFADGMVQLSELRGEIGLFGMTLAEMVTALRGAELGTIENLDDLQSALGDPDIAETDDIPETSASRLAPGAPAFTAQIAGAFDAFDREAAFFGAALARVPAAPMDWLSG